MRRPLWIAAAILFLALAGALYLSTTGGRTRAPSGDERSAAGVPPSSPRGSVAPGRQAPAFSLADISGNIVDSSRFAGKPTIVNFFATWCPPCREEVPALVKAYDRYRAEGLEVVGISLDTDTRENLPGFIAGNRIKYRILLGDMSTVRAYGGVSSLPTTVFIGKDGEIKDIHVGVMDGDSLEREIRELL